jgi:hypothetical protein
MKPIHRHERHVRQERLKAKLLLLQQLISASFAVRSGLGVMAVKWRCA